MDRCEDRISLLQQDKTTLEHDRDGYMGTCDMYKEQIRDLGAQIEKYRAAEASSFKVVREESDYLREAVSRVLVVIAQAKQGFALQFGRFGLPQSIAGDRQWGEVGRRLDLLWSEVAEYERIWKKRHPDRPPLGSAVIMVVTDLSEPLEPQRQRVEDAVRDIVDAIAEVRNRAEEHFRALMTMDKGLSQP